MPSHPSPAPCPLPPLRLSSGDAGADTRFAWAEGAREAGDLAGAIDLFAQAIERAPGFAPAHLGLARARLASGDRAGAADAARAALALDPADPFGAGLVLARAGGEEAGTEDGGEAREPPPALSPAFVARLFDAYAPRFDAHLLGVLGYRGPEVLADAVLRASAIAGREPHFARAIDLGCGTGLMGAAIRRRVDALDGVDLSPAMVEAARRTGVYGALHVGEARAFLAAEPGRSADLLLAADVLVYLGDLRPLFVEAARVLAPGGLLAATCQDGGATAEALGGVTLGADDRHAHSEPYLRRALAGAGLEPVLVEPASTRLDAGAPVPGLAFVARRPLEAGAVPP